MSDDQGVPGLLDPIGPSEATPGERRLLERYAGVGTLHRSPLGPVLAGVAPQALAGALEAYVVPLEPDVPAGDAHAFAQRVLEAPGGIGRVTVRLGPDAADDGSGGLRAVHVVKQPDAGLTVPSVPGIETRAYTDADEEFVQELLAVAVERGHGQAASPDEVRRAVRARYDLGGATDLDAVVAWRDGRRCGHVTWQEGVRDELTLERFLEVVDVFVTDDAGRPGVGGALTRHAERRAAELGLRLLGQVTVEPGKDWRPVFQRLHEAGWEPFSSLHAWDAP